MNARTAEQLIDQMNPKRHPAIGMDVVIVVTSNQHQETFWQTLLEESLGRTLKPSALVVAVCEDWEGGAGNGLGTLYAYRRARQKALNRYDVDIGERQAQGYSIAMYHTAGMGTRLFPIAGAEHNNKAAVRLPYGSSTTTLLEAVIRQTAIYSPGRGGRLSVFWGDQIFIPSVAPPDGSTSHADILTRMVPLPTAEEWRAQRLSDYGIIIEDENLQTRQLEKLAFETFQALSKSGKLGNPSNVGISLGSFSLSWPLLQALEQEFAQELSQKAGKLDSDQHFWMPLTLDRETYISIMAAKGMTKQAATSHHARMESCRSRFLEAEGTQIPLFAAIDIGAHAYWWDYGSVQSYYRNCHKLLQKRPEGEAMRLFYDLQERQKLNTLVNVDSDSDSIVAGSAIHSGRIRNSVVIGVVTDTIDTHDSVLIDLAAPELHAERALAYNAVDADEVVLKKEGVRADTFVAEGSQQFKMTTSLTRDGKGDWQQLLPGNPLTYAQLYQINQQSDLLESRRFEVRMRQQLGIIEKIQQESTMSHHSKLKWTEVDH